MQGRQSANAGQHLSSLLNKAKPQMYMTANPASSAQAPMWTVRLDKQQSS
jgi:hypothetical protein